jgi:hypothetical protein
MVRQRAADRGAVGVTQVRPVTILSRMPSKDDLIAKLDRLLRESAAVGEASEELVREAGRLRAEIEKHQAKEQRKKPRVKGK